MMKLLGAATALLLVSTNYARAETAVTPLLTHELQGVPGKEGAMLVVDYPPGGSDPIHRHNASVFVYVLEGSVVMQVKGQKAVTLNKGQTFFEGPQDVHLVGRNASKSEPAKFLAFFVKDQASPFVMPAKP
ncbi:cupin [Asaia sp. W19]|uniref:cupin domain-containing protein n=1 Tax=unclassified Asaia TaxID=2685023 RepID=UPI000F8CD124|nr:cupin domain-containing protein [Asaia sp. W19]RUT26069.1 cupin [Asaia sp. W19]